jgi:hypothetical protein
LPCACWILGVKRNRRKTEVAFPIWEGWYSSRRHGNTEKSKFGPRTYTDKRGYSEDRFFYVRSACGLRQAFGREEWVFVVRFPSDESLGFLLPFRSAGRHFRERGIVGHTQEMASARQVPKSGECRPRDIRAIHQSSLKRKTPSNLIKRKDC